MIIDMQQLLPLPRISTSVAYYLCKLWFYNFRIHIVCNEVASGCKYMFSWLESEGRKGGKKRREEKEGRKGGKKRREERFDSI